MLTLRFLIFPLFCFLFPLLGQDNEDCFECHADPDIVTEPEIRRPGLFVDGEALKKSIHEELACAECHADIDVDDLPHEDNLKAVYCGECHDDEQADFDVAIHGQAKAHNLRYAPSCAECHGKHDILSTDNPKSPSFKMNIPFLCGKCHREGAPVARVYDITEHNILSNYSQSIHGEGLFKKGLSVTAACVDCHTSHLILPHTDIRSSTSPKNVAKTCMKCHTRIEDVHVTVIEGEKWRNDPQSIPACTDCHTPHKARKESMTLTLADNACLKCHKKKDVHKVEDGKIISLTVERDLIKGSVHGEITCVKCHCDVNPSLKRPCTTADQVDCKSCHLLVGEEYDKSGHGKAAMDGVKDAPTCITCHDDHNIKPSVDETSLTYKEAIPKLCGECHREDSKVKEVKHLSETNAFFDYTKSVHGKSLGEKGFLSAANCTDCHSNHLILGHDDANSTINPKNIPATCSRCHRGIYKEYARSVHSINTAENKEKLPTCEDCHTAHGITKTGKDDFIAEVTNECGNCHGELSETYLETLHGETYKLGNLNAAKCSDCHGAHLILASSNPNSSIGEKNIVKTCQQCHEDANEKFTGYLTHATHHDKEKYPILYYTFWAMTFLLIGTFGLFGLHTLLWLPRSIQAARQHNQKKKNGSESSKYYIRRFNRSQRLTHIFVIISFITLALTGMILKFSGMAWAKFIAELIGGASVAAVLHRLAAIITFGYFFFHLFTMIKTMRARNENLRTFIFGPDSIMFKKQDLIDAIATIKWFVGMGPRPSYGRWTYWEKFDYFAVFWGVAVIGFSGLILWFPEFFTLFLPGWAINVSHIIHSDEALLAVGFIFTIHFFNTHLRPEAFPMDTVIFTGLIPYDEFKATRPREYEELKKKGGLRKKLVKKEITPQWEKVVKVFGFVFLFTGIVLVLLIIYSMLFGYK